MEPDPQFTQQPIPQAPKKGIPVLGWVGIGCGSIIVLGIIIAGIAGFFAVKAIKGMAANPEKTAAEFMVSLNPDLKKVSENDAKGEMTISTKDGQTFTVSYKELSNGNFSYKDSEGNIVKMGGNTDITEVPAWVPRAPGITETSSVISSVKAGKASGVYVVKSSETVEAIDTFFKEEGEKAGFSASTNTSSSLNGTERRDRTISDSGHEVSVVVTSENGQPATVWVTYQEK